MPNWAKGTLKLRGRVENIASALKYMLLDDNTASVEEKYEDRKSTRLNSSHANISYAVFCLKKKNHEHAAVGGVRQARVMTRPDDLIGPINGGNESYF